MAAKPKYNLAVTLQNELQVEALRTVLMYEGGAKGLSMAQALYELVMRAANTESYPEEARAELARIASEGEQDATRRLVDMVHGPIGRPA